MTDLALKIKENDCYVAQDFKKEIQQTQTKTYYLPNKKELKVSTETLIKCPEILFSLEEGASYRKSIHDQVWDSIIHSDKDV